MPSVQVYTYDRALAESRGKLDFVAFVLEETFNQTNVKDGIVFSTIYSYLH